MDVKEYWLAIRGLNECGICVEEEALRITVEQAEMLERIGLHQIVHMLVGD